MLYIKNPSTNPYFNLAAEEFIMENIGGEVVMLWRNDRTVVLGKNQNFYSEINLPFARENNISVVRRLTGGGCVFHDLGNINFTYITPKKDGLQLNFAHFTAPVIKTLNQLGVNAELSGRNDITAEGKKISGNAQCVYKNMKGEEKILHHGTLLFNADLAKLAGVLNADEEKVKSKGVKSVRGRVGNIYDFLPGDKKMTAELFFAYLERSLTAENDCAAREFSPAERRGISLLAETKYRSEDFLFGGKPSYSYRKKQRFDFGTVEVSFNTEGLIIRGFKIHGDFFGESDVAELEKKFEGLAHKLEDVEKTAESAEIWRYISGMKPNEFKNLLF